MLNLIFLEAYMTNRFSKLITFTLFSLFISGFSNAYDSKKDNSEPTKSGKVYIMSDDQMADVDSVLLSAKKSGKLALIAMGANWCHDSRSLAKKLHLPEVSEGLNNNYEVLFVDVGYLSHVKDVITRFGQPVIYATPTVLVIEPETGKQLNGHNMHQWRDAANLSVEDTIKYFADIANGKTQLLADLSEKNTQNSGRLKQLNSQIDDFQNFQAERLYKAFSVIGPLLEKEKNDEDAPNLDSYWRTVAKYRYKITVDLAELREQANELAHSEELDGKLDFPDYEAFEWEK